MNAYRFAQNAQAWVDPLGESPFLILVAVALGKALASGALELAAQAAKKWWDDEPIECFDWNDVAIAAVAGLAALGLGKCWQMVNKVRYSRGAIRELNRQLKNARTQNRIMKLHGRIDTHNKQITESVHVMQKQAYITNTAMISKKINGDGEC